MIICKRPATSDDHLGEGVHQGDRGDGTEGGEERRRRRKRKIVSDGRADQSKVVQEVLADLKSEQNRITIPVSLFLSG